MKWLKKLEDERIVSVEKRGDKFRITEECDGYFSLELTHYELNELIQELIEFSRDA